MVVDEQGRQDGSYWVNGGVNGLIPFSEICYGSWPSGPFVNK